MTNFKSHLYNQYEWYGSAGSFTWVKPADLDASKPILVHVWGAGGAGADNNSYTGAVGGGGGGLAVKLIPVASLAATETLIVGAGNTVGSAVGGSSSFGAHCSATGGNGGALESPNAGSNGGASGTANRGVGGLGVGGDVNRRGGQGGADYYSTSNNAGGGGGGSAPAPYGISNGFNGGQGSTYAGGGGGGIGGAGQMGSYTGGSGGGSMRFAPRRSPSPSSYYTPQPGACGLFGPGGSAGVCNHGYVTYGGNCGVNGQNASGQFLLSPNEIALGGGGGAAGMYSYVSTQRLAINATNGGPGGGGGGVGKYTTTVYPPSSGHGGVLGGGGGSPGYQQAGSGGNAGGAGGVGYASSGGFAKGGDGLIIIQYARLL